MRAGQMVWLRSEQSDRFGFLSCEGVLAGARRQA